MKYFIEKINFRSFKANICGIFIFMVISSLLIVGYSSTSFAASDANSTLKDIRNETQQPGFQQTDDPYSRAHPKASKRPGADSISSAFLFTADYIVLITTSLGVLYLVIAFVKLIKAGDQIDEEINKQKETIKWVIFGLILIVLADEIVLDMFFGRETGAIQPGQGYKDVSTVKLLSKEFIKEIVGLYNAIFLYIVYIALIVVIISGFRMIVQSGQEEAVTSAKKHIFMAMLGLVILGMAEALVFVFYPQPDQSFDIARMFELIVNIITFAISFVVFLAVGVIMYAGYLYVFYYGQDDMIEKAKKVLKGAIFALIVSSLAYGIVYTAISLQHTTTELEVIEFQ